MMNIHNFEKNDVITRVEPGKRGDSSYMCNRLILVGVKDESIVLVHERHGVVILPEYYWGEGWNYYPDELVGIGTDMKNASSSLENPELINTPPNEQQVY